jgi:hypothetical protein
MRQSHYPVTIRLFASISVLLLGNVRVMGDEAHVRRPVSPRDHQYCGVDSLYIFLKRLGHDQSLAEMEENLPPTPRGISVEAIARYCENRDVKVSVVRASLDRLTDGHLPAILLVNDDHFVTVVATDEDRLLVFDNAYGLADCTAEWFMKQYRWDGLAIVEGNVSLELFISDHAAAGWMLAAALAAGAAWILIRRPARLS